MLILKKKRKSPEKARILKNYSIPVEIEKFWPHLFQDIPERTSFSTKKISDLLWPDDLPPSWKMKITFFQIKIHEY